jgi:hypothetical protein
MDVNKEPCQSAQTRGASTIFQQDWWLQAASDGAVEKVVVRRGGSDIANISFVRKNHFPNFCYLVMPMYTRTLGPVLNLPLSEPAQRAKNVRRTILELVSHLPKHDRFFTLLDCEDDTDFAFSLAGCVVGQQFTFRVAAHANATQLMTAVEPPTARLIRSAGRRLNISRHADFDRFVALSHKDRPSDESVHDLATLRRLFSVCTARNQATILSLCDAQDNDVASVIIIWDSSVLYYWVPLRDRKKSGGDANAMLLWSAMEFALDRKLIFDVDSYMSVGTATFLSSFGFPRRVRSLVVHHSMRGLLVETLRGQWRNRTVRDPKPDPLSGILMTNLRRSKR